MKYDVILFTDNAARFGHTRPMGAYRVATELRNHGYTVKVVDFTCKIMLNHSLFTSILEGLIGPNTLFVGFSSSYYGDYSKFDDDELERANATYSACLPLFHLPVPEAQFNIWLKLMKRNWPHVKIVYGGNYAYAYNTLPNDLDFVIPGYADTTIIELTNHIKHGTPIKHQPLTGKKFKVIDHDKLALSYDFANGGTFYHSSDHIVPGEILSLETSRGCMFQCKFCGFPLLGRKRTDPAYHRLEKHMTEELRRNWEEFGVRKYIIIDHTFNETSEKLESMIRAKEAAKVDFEFTCFARLDLIHKNPEQISLLKELGIKSAFFGVESFHEPSAKSIGKGMKSDEVKEMLYLLKDSIKDYTNTISLIAGLPYETPDTLAASMEWVLDPNSPVDCFGLQQLGLKSSTFPSDFSRNYRDYGYTMDESGFWTNDIWDQGICKEISREYQIKAYNSGKLKMSNFEVFGLMTYGYEFNELSNIPAKDVDWKKFKNHLVDRYNTYINTMLDAEDIKYTGKV